MNGPLHISVVIPAYNAAGSIAQSIQSCLSQTLLPAEIILVDDGSTDATIQVAQKAYPDIIVIKLDGNSGPSVARNKGWDAAKGNIIAFIDSDDTWHPQKLEIIASLFQNDSSIVFIGHPYTLQKDYNTRYANSPALIKKDWFSILLSNPFQTSCISLRKDINYRFDNSYRYCEDHELAVRAAYNEGCYFIDCTLTILGRPQLTTGGASARLWKMRMGQLRIYSSIPRFNILYVLLVPILWIFSLLKHVLLLIKRAVS